MDTKPKTINQVANLAGITVRTLHYYDKIDLLKPTYIAKNNYRIYDEFCLKRLQEILFFKELQVPLKEIKQILDDKSYDKEKILANHKKLLTMKRNRLNELIKLIDKILGDDTVSLKEFDMKNIKEETKKYAKEAKEKWGDTNAYKQSRNKTSKYTTKDWEKMNNESTKIYMDFIDCMNQNTDCKSAESLVREWKNHITKYYYDCTNEILQGLGDMYVADIRFKNNINKHGEGLAEFMSESIKDYCKNK